MRLFVSAGEPSGDLHGANLLYHLRRQCPGVEVLGLGGERMAAAGCELVYPLCDLALVGFAPVLASLPQFYRVLGLARQSFRARRPDALVLIDYPGFHWWLAGCARKLGIPVVYFVPPQLWAWAGWRVRKMRRLVDRVLCNLPFEEDWYRCRNVPALWIGHPYFDELRQQRLDEGFLAQQRRRPGTVIAVLPGSRDQELRLNVPSLLRAAGLVHARRPETRFLVACLKPEQAAEVSARLAPGGPPVEVHAGRTPEIIELAHSCLAVSGSVSLELLFRGKPSVILYRQHWAGILAAGVLMRCQYITLVNLLADRAVFPEYLTARCPAPQMAEHVVHWLQDRRAYEGLCAELAALRDRVAEPGACGRAAEAVLEVAGAARPRAA
jgi:lipid-A-disaccharide synthase